MTRVLGISAAQAGWFAKFNDGAGEYKRPVVVWALAEDDGSGRRFLTSYSVSADGSLDQGVTDHEDPNFEGYVSSD